MSEAETKEPSEFTEDRMLTAFNRISAHCGGYVDRQPRSARKYPEFAFVKVIRLEAIADKLDSHTALVAAAESVLAWRVADFDTIAEMFYRETGYLRPGKDYPVGMGGESVRKEAEAAWNVWVDRKNAELTDQLTAAIAAAKESER